MLARPVAATAGRLVPCGLNATCGEQTGGVRPPPPLRGGASHEAEGRGEAQGGRVGRVRPLAGWHRLRLLREILDEWCFRHQLLLPRPYLVLTKPLRLDIQCQRAASVKIGWKYLDD